jgi:hypothetical protein
VCLYLKYAKHTKTPTHTPHTHQKIQNQANLFPAPAPAPKQGGTGGLSGTDPSQQDQTVLSLLQHLLLPRALLSPEDAVYAPRFLHLLHGMDAPGFPSLRCFDMAVRALAPLVFSATDQEVSFGSFFLVVCVCVCTFHLVAVL